MFCGKSALERTASDPSGTNLRSQGRRKCLEQNGHFRGKADCSSVLVSLEPAWFTIAFAGRVRRVMVSVSAPVACLERSSPAPGLPAPPTNGPPPRGNSGDISPWLGKNQCLALRFCQSQKWIQCFRSKGRSHSRPKPSSYLQVPSRWESHSRRHRCIAPMRSPDQHHWMS